MRLTAGDSFISTQGNSSSKTPVAELLNTAMIGSLIPA